MGNAWWDLGAVTGRAWVREVQLRYELLPSAFMQGCVPAGIANNERGWRWRACSQRVARRWRNGGGGGGGACAVRLVLYEGPERVVLVIFDVRTWDISYRLRGSTCCENHAAETDDCHGCFPQGPTHIMANSAAMTVNCTEFIAELS